MSICVEIDCDEDVLAKDRCRKHYLKLQYREDPVGFKERAKKYQNKLRIELMLLLGTKCVRCGFDDIRALQIDHIEGKGHNERVNIFGSIRLMYRYYRDNPEQAKKKLQILCANCNWIKKHENNEVKETNDGYE